MTEETDLDPSETWEIIQEADDEVKAELYEIARKQVDYESARLARIDGKATQLLSLVGLSITLSVSIGGGLIATHGPKIAAHIGEGWSVLLVVLFFLMIAAGMFAGWHALKAHSVRNDFVTANPHQVFDKQTMKKIALYKGAMAHHLWFIAQDNSKLIKAKAQSVRIGQEWYARFIACAAALIAASGLLALFTFLA